MNFFAHGIAFLHDPYFLAGTAVPDWMSVADRPARVRGRLIERFLLDSTAVDPDAPEVRLACGARQHLRDDDWFHQQSTFIELNARLGKLFRAALGPDDNFRAGFLGHIVTEMLLDRVLIERRPKLLDQYYQALAELDPVVVEQGVNRIATQTTVRLAPLIPRFIAERFLFDYLDEAKMRTRLNQVMRRVKLPELPPAIEDVLTESHVLVSARFEELLPGHASASLIRRAG